MRSRRSETRRAALALAVLLAAAAAVRGQTVVQVKGGGALRGRLHSAPDAEEIVLNTFHSRSPVMTLGVERIPRAKVKRIETVDPPLARWAEARRRVAPDDAAGLRDLGRLLEEGGFRPLALDEYVRAAAADPSGRLGPEIFRDAWGKTSRSDPRLNPALRDLLAAFLAEPDAAARRQLHARAASEAGFERTLVHLERARRSKARATGRHNDRTLTLRSRTEKGVYTLFVPSGYDPLVPHPLVLGLHGGGPAGKDGKDVVGSGASAMNFYEHEAARRGLIVVCPTAVQAPWSAPANESFVLTVLEEILLHWNVDENRIYLTGHSMGGFGTWAFGPKLAHLFAAIAPMAGGGSNNLKRLADTGTGIYIYHGADDPVVGVGDSRRAAESLRKDAADFVYTEIPDSGHGCPREVVEECFDYFEAHRLHAAPGRAARGTFTPTRTSLSSFDRRVTADEKTYLGDPLVDDEAAAGSPEALLRDLRRGGGNAEEAAAKLGALRDPRTFAALESLAGDAEGARDVRCAAATALGAIGRPESIPALAKACAAEDPVVVAAAARALGAIGDRRGLPALDRALRSAATLLKSKLVGADRIGFTDWEKVHDLTRAVVEALARVGNAATAKTLADFPAERLLLADFRVDYTTRAGQDPEAPRRELGRAVLAALRALDAAGSAAVIDRLAARFGG